MTRPACTSLIVGALLALGGTAVGQDGESFECSGFEFEACGGEPGGTWTLTSGCMFYPEGSALVPGCPDAVFEPVVTVSGEMSLHEDGTYRSQQMNQTSVRVILPLSCLGPSTCAQSAGAAEFEETDETCTIIQSTDEGAIEHGTFALDGSTLTLTDEAQGPVDVDFCVSGDELILRMTDPVGLEGVLRYVRAGESADAE